MPRRTNYILDDPEEFVGQQYGHGDDPIGQIARHTSPIDDIIQQRHINSLTGGPLTEAEYGDYLQAEEKQSPGWKALHWLGGILDKPFRPFRAAAAWGRNKLIGGNATFDPREFLAFLPYSDKLGWTDPKTATEPRELFGYARKKPGEGLDRGDLLGFAADVLIGSKFFPRFGPHLKPGPVDPVALKDAHGMTTGLKPFVGGAGGSLTEQGALLGRHNLLPQDHWRRLAGISDYKDLPYDRLMAARRAARDTAKEALKDHATALGRGTPEYLEMSKRLTSDMRGLNDIIKSLGRGEHVPLQGVFTTPLTGPVGTKPGLVQAAATYAMAPWSLMGYGGDVWRNWLKYSSLVRPFRQAFVGATMGQPTAVGQQMAEYMVMPKTEQALAEAGKVMQRGVSQFRQAGLQHPDLDRLGPAMSDIAELGPGAAPRGTPKVVPDVINEIQTGADRIKRNFIDKGGIVPDLEPGLGYQPRYGTGESVLGGTGARTTSTLHTSPHGSMARDLPPGLSKNVANAISLDDLISGAGATKLRGQQALNHIRQKYGGIPGGVAPGDEAAVFEWARSLPPSHVERGSPFFAGNSLADWTRHMGDMAKGDAGLSVMHKMLSLHAMPMKTTAVPQGGLVPLDLALKKLTEAGQGAGVHLDLTKASDYLATQLQAFMGIKARDPRALMYSMGVPRQVLDALSHTVVAINAPEAASAMHKYLAGYNALTKVYATSIWPSYQTTNSIGGVLTNWMAGVPLKGYGDANTVLFTRNPIKGISGAMPQFGASDAAATSRLIEEAVARGVATGRGGVAREIASAHGQHHLVDQVLQPGMSGFMGGTQPWNLGSLSQWNPLNVRGARDAVTGGANAAMSGQPLVRLGETIATSADNVNRLAHFFGKLRQGYSLDAAAASAKAAHADVSLLSNFEKSWMRDLTLFYTWPRLAGEYIVRQGLTSPGKLGVLVQATQLGEGGDEYRPEMIRQAMNLTEGGPKLWEHPVSGRQELRQAYRQIVPSMPHEEIARWFQAKPGGGTMQQIMSVGENIANKGGSMLAPLPKWIGQSLRGKKFFNEMPVGQDEFLPGISTERSRNSSLSGLYGIVDWVRSRPAGFRDFLSDYGPASRAINTFDRARAQEERGVTPMEYFSPFTGGIGSKKVVDLISARDRDARDTLEQHLRGIPGARAVGEGVAIPSERMNTVAALAAAGNQEALEQLLRYRAYQRARQLGEERGLERLLEKAHDVGPVFGRIDPRSRERIDAEMLLRSMDSMRSQIELARRRREWENSLDMVSRSRLRDPVARQLGRQRSQQMRDLAMSLGDF